MGGFFYAFIDQLIGLLCEDMFVPSVATVDGLVFVGWPNKSNVRRRL